MHTTAPARRQVPDVHQEHRDVPYPICSEHERMWRQQRFAEGLRSRGFMAEIVRARLPRLLLRAPGRRPVLVAESLSEDGQRIGG